MSHAVTIVAFDGQLQSEGGVKTPVFLADGKIFKAASFGPDGIHANASSLLPEADLEDLAAGGAITMLPRPIPCPPNVERGLILLVTTHDLMVVLQRGGIKLDGLLPVGRPIAAKVFEPSEVPSFTDALVKACHEAFRSSSGRKGEDLDRAFSAAYRLNLANDDQVTWRLSVFQGAIRWGRRPYEERQASVRMIYDARIRDPGAQLTWTDKQELRWSAEVYEMYGRV